MKKIFTLIAMALMAIGAQAQIIQFDEAKTAGNLASEYSNGDFKIALTDPENKMVIDKNSQYFGDATKYQQFGACRLNTKGKSTSTKNFITVTVPADGTIFIAVRSGSSSDARTINIKQGTNEAKTFTLKDADAASVNIGGEDKKVFPYISTTVSQGNDIVVSYPDGAMYIYAFIFSTNGELPTGIQTVKAGATENGTTYNLAGQKVDENYKGVVIQNGKKVVVK